MTPSGAEAERKQAARAGRRMLERALPPGFVRWVDRIAESQDAPEEVHAWAGSLAAIATDLEQAFLESGTEVRDRILGLHAMLSGGEVSREALPGRELEPFLPWLIPYLESSPDSPSPRIVLMQWIDVASERLTLRRYHRPDLPAHHARTLIVVPARTLGIPLAPPEDEKSAARESGATRETEIALALLRFVDLLDAGRLSAQGKNRISAPDTGEFGGFYGVSENVQPPSTRELEAEMAELQQDLAQLLEISGLAPAVQVMLEDMKRALRGREERGSWPTEYRWKTPEERRRPVSLLRRILKRR